MGVVLAPALQISPELLDGVQIRQVRRQVQDLTARLLNPLAGLCSFVKRGVVPHDHAAAQQTGQQLLLKPSVEHLDVAAALKEHGSDQFADAISP